MVLRIEAPWLRAPATLTVMDALAANGAEPRFVGGCVRNALIGGPPTDVDIVVGAPPEETSELLRDAGIRTEPVGFSHGVILAVVNGTSFEIASLRRDVKTDGRRAEVSFGVDWLDDARRRDFTINALYADREGRVYDILGRSLADLEARRVRFIGDPAKRIQEDYLRILRLFRFHAWYGEGDMEPSALVACAGLAHGLERVARERIGAEIIRLLAAPDPAIALKAMEQTGVLDIVLPDARRGAPMAALVALERRYGFPPDAPRRLALLTRGASPQDVMRDLRLSRHAADELAARRLSGPVGGGAAARRLGYARGVEAARDLMLIAAADGGPPLQTGLFAEAAEGARQKFPLSAQDLLIRGFSPGPRLGEALARAEEEWLASDFLLDRATLIAQAVERRAAG